MNRYFIEAVYGTLSGELVEECCVPGVDCIFEDGMLCDMRYSDVYAAYERLRQKLGVADDEDVETIINALMDICHKVGYHMFLYGARFGVES